MMKKIAGLFLLALVACSDSPTEPSTSPAGTWVAHNEGLTVELRLSGVGALSGCVGFGFDPEFKPNDRVFVAVSGSEDGGAVALGAVAGQAIEWSFDGNLTPGDSLIGAMAGTLGTGGDARFGRADARDCP